MGYVKRRTTSTGGERELGGGMDWWEMGGAYWAVGGASWDLQTLLGQLYAYIAHTCNNHTSTHSNISVYHIRTIPLLYITNIELLGRSACLHTFFLSTAVMRAMESSLRWSTPNSAILRGRGAFVRPLMQSGTARDSQSLHWTLSPPHSLIMPVMLKYVSNFQVVLAH